VLSDQADNDDTPNHPSDDNKRELPSGHGA
jgi:hypothetical protein